MNRYRRNLICSGLVVVLALMPSNRLNAQTFTSLYSLTASDGSEPYGGLANSSNVLFGATLSGGASNNGTLFAVDNTGRNFRTLYSFTGDDGYGPRGDLVLTENRLYGTVFNGGSPGGYGTVFAINTDGTGYTNLHHFTGGTDGARPLAGLVLSGTTLYGITSQGGLGNGNIFALNTDGTGFTNLYSLSISTSDGRLPCAPLVVGENAIFGTAQYGGNWDNGTVFRLNADGTCFTNLHSFGSTSFGTNDDGTTPTGLVLSGDTLYGIAQSGGSFADGTIFKLKIDGTEFTVLHEFTALSPSLTNYDGAGPFGGLALVNNTLYGTAVVGGVSGGGTLFRINTDGSGFETLYAFTWGDDGGYPCNRVSLFGNILYGTTRAGGTGAVGTVFSYEPQSQPRLSLVQCDTNVVAMWPTNNTGFTLQYTTNLVAPVVWLTVPGTPVVIGNLNAITNPISDGQGFFRLIQ